MLKEMFENVKKTTPLIHNITNYVTVNDCANILLACGGSPIMSDDSEDVYDITSICGGLNINIGTLNKNTIESMFIAGKRANELGHPVILDPVGAGASALRTNTAKKLLNEVKFTAIRGNISEIKALGAGTATTKGVDASADDAVTKDNLSQTISFAAGLSDKTGAVIAITGPVDIITDGKTAYLVRNGHPMLSKITGSGCMLTALCEAYITANKSHALEAVTTAVTIMGICGEIAEKKTTQLGEGILSFRNHLVDAVYNLTAEDLENMAKVEKISL